MSVSGSAVLVTGASRPRPVLLRPEEAEGVRRQAESVILLGEAGGHVYFAVDLAGGGETALPRPVAAGQFRSLREVAALLERQEAGLLAYAKAMTYWHRRNRFCGECGAPTASAEGGHLRACTSRQCGRQHFPRTDPAIIVRVTRGSRCLLGRQPTWPEGLYSIIAGFVEPGESLEAAVVRELREETGVRVTRIQYHSSQPWPFPSSLMLGFIAQATRTTIRLHDGELEDARWLSREDIINEVEQGKLQLPSDISISRLLLAEWFDAGGLGKLRDLIR